MKKLAAAAAALLLALCALSSAGAQTQKFSAV